MSKSVVTIAALGLFGAGIGVALLSSTPAATTFVGSSGPVSDQVTSGQLGVAAASPTATPACTSNEDPAHEKAESAAREAAENAGDCHAFGGPRGPGRHGSNEDPAHEAQEGAAREAQENAQSSPAPAATGSTGATSGSGA